MSRVSLSSTLEAVTVYKDRAQLTFTAKVQLQPGTMVVAIEEIEKWGNIDWNTLTFRLGQETPAELSAAVLLQNIRPETEIIIEDVREKVQVMRNTIEALEDDEVLCKGNIAVMEESMTQIEAISSLITKAGTGKSDSMKEDRAAVQMYAQNPTNWGEMAVFLAHRRAFTAQKILELNLDLKRIREKLRDARAKLQEMGGNDATAVEHNKKRLEATLLVSEEVVAGTDLQLECSYVVLGACWSPQYDLRVHHAESKMEVFYYANVQQSTAMSWEKVRLYLSTATPHFDGTPPPLRDRWEISLEQPAVQKPSFKCRSMPATCNLLGGAGMMLGATVSAVGPSSTAMVYAIPGLSSVSCTNAPVKVTVAHQTFPIQLELLSIPKLNSFTYLTAKATNTTEYELLAGPSRVFYGNTFVSSSNLDTILPGNEFTLSLGAEESVQVNRSLVRREVRKKSSLFSSDVSTIVRFHYSFEVSSGQLSGSAGAVLLVRDNFPVSSNSELVVELKEPVPGGNSNESRNPQLTYKIDEDTNEITWRLEMTSHKKSHFDLKFETRYPTSADVFGLN